ncbi:MAG TPA: AI-2E family transporter YdiK [Vicinamibacterales bacterium]|jgi:predicted PurR-regulated permease PerM|nr:AI-2E family transporter YdiK [Vicinamibacterales bacterium]
MRHNHRETGNIAHTTLSVIVLVLLVAASVWILSPFLTSLLWATIISVAVWPSLMRLEILLGGRRGLAVALLTVTVLLVVFVPLTLALTTMVKSVQQVTTQVESLESIPLPPPPAALEHVPFAGKWAAAKWTSFVLLSPQERAAVLAPYAQSALQWFIAKAGSLGAMALQLLFTAIITPLLLVNGEAVRDGILRFAERLADQRGHDAAVRAAETIRGVVLGVVVTAIVQAAIGGIGLFVSGVPAAGLLTAVMLFLCLAQIGPILVLIPATAWLYWSGQTTHGTTLLVIAVIALTIDNIVRPVLIKRGANLPLVLIFAGVIGGLVAFGVVGIFIGPVVLTVAYTLLATWVADADRMQPTAERPAVKAML